jgi:hypothetical protein
MRIRVGLVALDPSLEVRGRPVLDQVREVRQEFLRPAPACVIGLRQREDLLKLVEDEDRGERPARRVLEHVVPVVQELPERLAFHGGAGLGPRSRGLGRKEKRALDLLGGGRGPGVIVEPHVDRAVSLGPQPRDEAGLEDGRLAEARLAEEDREELALHPPAELRDLLVAAVEETAGLLGERDQAEPGVLGVDRRQGWGLLHSRWPLRNSCRRWTNSGVGSPPCSLAKCTALNFSGAMASASVVESMHTGRMKTEPSAMPRVRSTA